MTDAAALDGPNTPHVVVTANGEATREIPLLDELTIGRAEDNDLKLFDPKVSRHHACIAREGPRFVLTDLGSANGTFVDGDRLTCPHYLRHGQRIAIGDVTLTFHESVVSSATTLVTAVPAAVKQAAQAAGMQRPAPPAAAPVSGPVARRESRGLTIGLILAGVVLVLAVVVFGAYVLAPGLFGRGETATPEVAVAASPTAAPVVPTLQPATAVPEPTQPPTAVPNPITLQELDEQLSGAQDLVRRSKFEGAIAIYQDLAGRAPGDPRAETGWAWALIYDDQAEQALAHAQKAAQIAPDDADAAAVLARAHVDLGDKAEALSYAQVAVKLGMNNAAAHAVLSEALRLNQRYQEATDQADLALVQDINNADAHRARAWLYYLVDEDMGRATGELHIAAALQTELWLRRHELGELLLKAKNYTTAIIAFQDALALRPKAVTYSGIGQAYYELGQYDPARISLDQAVQAGAKDAATSALLASSYARLGRCDEARAAAADALAADAENALALDVQAVCQVGAPPPTAVPTAVAELTKPAVTPKPTRTALQSPLSGQLAFPVYNGETNSYDVYTARIDGTSRRLVAEGFDQPSFSPDGRWLAVRGRRPDLRNLFVIRPDGSGIKKISENVEDNSPSWSPDSSRLLFASTKDQPGHPKAIYVIDPVPTTGRTVVEGRRVETGSGPVQGEFGSWMPDGRLAYKGCDYQVAPMSCGIFIINSGGGKFAQLTKKETDTAPVGCEGRIAFMSNRDGNWEIYLVRDDASHLKRLTNNASDDGLPAWSPDCKTIAFVSNQGGPWAVWAMNPDGSARRKLFDIGGEGLDAYWANQRISWIR